MKSLKQKSPLKPQVLKISYLVCAFLAIFFSETTSVHIYTVTSSNEPLPKLFKLCPGVKIDPDPGVTRFS